MGFFRHSSATAPTDTIPASTTLSAPARTSRRITLAATTALSCAGIFYVAAVNANPNPPAPNHTRSPASHSAVELTLDQQSTNVTPSFPDTSSEQPQTTTSVRSSFSSDGTSTNVSVNGQPIAVPQNGSVSKTIVDNNGVTTLEVHSSTDGDSQNNTFTSLNVNVNSSTTSFDDNSP